ncbi:SNF2-related protein [Burkholderia cenocepacia]|uniref:SNF2-related protein n=1 Tax=Burkholderia cenocepacia TaxID=95486 RepID=UPI0023B8EBDF|nr:SNF2-related protein [Burkholderia cenocepacia]MDF0506804.1 SNF2-related protein [Burkholderia cenocepacia]
MTLLFLDDATNSVASNLHRLKLAKEAGTLIIERASLTESPHDVMRSLKIGKRLREIALELGIVATPSAPQQSPLPADATPARPTAELYPDEGKRTLVQRQKDNNAAIELLHKIQAGEVEVTDTERAILAKYSGNGGGLVGADGLSGSPHEYYTPKPVASAMWGLLGELGFTGGLTLDPSAGSGIFTATRPASAVMTQVELDETSGAINAAINDGPTVSTTVSPFEAVAASTPDEIYDAVITNVPFGNNAMRGGNEKRDARFQSANLQEYFVLRSLQKLKPGGLAAFIVPKSVVSGLGAKERKLRLNASLMAEFVGAYRLPNSIFTTAAADVTTDLIVFRKFSRSVALKIEELQAQSPSLLSQARVLWDEFLDGQYFKGAGHKYILGEEGTTKGKFGEVAAVINNDSIANIVKMIRRFPHSHIDWDLLEATETAPIVYIDGDVIHSNGQTLEMRDGEWVTLDSPVTDDREMVEVGTKVQKPLDAVNAGITWDAASKYGAYCIEKGIYSDAPSWLVATTRAIETIGAGDAQPWWEAICAGMAAMQLMQDADATEPTNYVAEYPTLSAQLAKCQSYANKSIGKASRLVKDALMSIRNARVKGEFTPFWRGEIQANVAPVALTPTQLYEKVRYEAEDETGYVPVDKLRETFSDFDPLTADEWCIAPDGKSVMHANDYYRGTYAAFLAQATADLDAASDPDVRAKIARQVEAAKSRINVVDVSTMTFSLFTPHVTNLQKLDFLKQYVSPDIFLTTDADGREMFDIKQPGLGKFASEEERAAYKSMQRFVKGYLKNQNITTMSKAVDVEDDPEKEAALLRRIKEISDKAKAQFDAWARANEEIQVSLHNRLNSPEALRFIEEPDGTPVDIPNLNTDTFRPHPYQYAAVRKYSRNFSGILGFDVGLGKTLTALAATQYAHSIGVKKKTVFVVPNATLTNWKKEAGKAYLDTSDCLFVGVVPGKKGKDKVDNAQVKVDLNRIRENRHSKIFMTLEAFKLIPLRDETMESYITYLAENDDAYLLAEHDASKKRANIAAASKAGNVRDTGVKSGALPFFEDMGIDSLVLDEAHNYKNSKLTSSEFKSAKYLADPAKSQRGMDMQAKAWYVRGLTPRNDGVLSLTATPITNSPLEVYAMLTLALGEREVNAMYGVNGADSFMAAACDIDEREEENIVGMMRPVRVFSGLQNAGLLRRLLQSAAVVKTAEDVKADGININVPEYDELPTNVDIGQESFDRIMGYKEEYLRAVELLKAGKATPEVKLAASPFNLIRKMTRVINDPEMDAGIFTFKHAANEGEAAQKAIAAFNARNFVEERDYDDPNADPADVRTKLVKDTETGESITKFLVTVRARAASSGPAIELLSTDFAAQDLLLKLMASNGIEPDINVSPKLAAVIDNVRKEAATPRHMGHAKQIIFCDELSLHHKIRIAIAKAVGISLAKIKIVNATSVDVAGMQDVQDGYNADGEDNKYEYVIANKKAEVGINLQKGTQAIHHMTIGWTPDSIHQRNGRGVRQGNPIDSVNVYHYDANGTFDAYKRKLVGIKADWIGALMQGDSSKIKIEGDMSASDYELLANAVGDASAMDRVNDEISARNKRQKIAANKVAQLQSVRIIEAQVAWLSRFGADMNGDERRGFAQWVKSKTDTILSTRSKIAALRLRMDESKSDLTHARLRKQVDELSVKLDSQVAVLSGLPVDSTGVPAARNVYQAITDQDRASTGYTNYKKDLTIAERMKEEAAVSFRNRTDDGYSGESLAAFMAGNAQIIAGTLVAIGSLVEYQNQLLVVRPARRQPNVLVGYNPVEQSETELLRMTGAVFVERNAPEWSALVSRAVAIDEATIAANKEGFESGSQDLFASLVSDVRDAITVPIPSHDIDRDSFSFKAPYFPYALEEGANGSAFVDRIKAEQAPVVSEGDRYNTVRVSDLRLVGPSVGTSIAERMAAIRQYAIAHKLRATAQDLVSVSSRLTMRDALTAVGLDKEFFQSLPNGVASCQSPEDLDVWALKWFNTQQDYLIVTDLSEALGYDLRRYREQQNKIDDGRERWITVGMDMRYVLDKHAKAALQAAIEGGFLADEIAEYSNITYSSYMPAGLQSAGVPRKFAEVLFEEDDFIELKVGVEAVRAAMSLSNNARLYVQNWGDAVSLAMSIFASSWQSIIGWAKKARALKAIDSAGVDVKGMLIALRNQPGVIAAEIGARDEFVAPSRYIKGSYQYEAGKYITLALVRGSETFEKVASAGAAGLQGRTFDNGLKAFRIVTESGKTFSNGAPVASLESLFKHLGLNSADYQV